MSVSRRWGGLGRPRPLQVEQAEGASRRPRRVLGAPEARGVLPSEGRKSRRVPVPLPSPAAPGTCLGPDGAVGGLCPDPEGGAARGRGPALCSHSAEAINTAKRKPGWGLGGEIQSCVDDLASLCNECGVRKTGRLWLHAMGPARGHPGGSWELGWPGPATTTGHPHPADARVVMGSQPPRPATEAHTGPKGRRGLGRPPVLRAHPPPSDRPPKPSPGHAAFMPRTGREAWPWAEIPPVLEPRGSSARQHPQVHAGALPLPLRAWGHEGPTRGCSQSLADAPGPGSPSGTPVGGTCEGSGSGGLSRGARGTVW